MSGNLRERLNRIRLMQEAGASPKKESGISRPPASPVADTAPFFAAEGWVPAGHLTLRREAEGCLLPPLPDAIPAAADIVMPGIGNAARYEDLLFFDLETTGLSGGAGTLAFLAAFGKISSGRLSITQYLLLDYPGEYDFVRALLAEFRPGVTIVSYNGKTFDSQILKTRCLMNGIAPPEYCHADLLHPSRRLWKGILPDCSQGTVETGILGIDRSGDIPGAMAPDIWFAFLKTGDTAPLMGICEHNRRDISGLAAIFCAMTTIADDPFGAMDRINFDAEALAIRWNREWGVGSGEWGVGKREKVTGNGEQGMGGRLLRLAAEKGGMRAALVLGRALLRSGEYAEGRGWLLKAAGGDQSVTVRALALRSLAIDSERRLKDAADARALAERGLELLPEDSSLRDDFLRRLERINSRNTLH